MKIGIRLAVVTIAALAVLSSGIAVIGQADPTAVGAFGTYKVAADKQDPSKLPFIGAWRINLDKSHPGIRGRFKETATQTFEAENGGLRHSVYLFWPPKVDNYRTVMTLDACRERLKTVMGDRAVLEPEQHLRPATSREVLMRMLMNLKRIAFRAKDFERALACCERIVLLAPDSPLELRDRGLAYEQLDAFGAAAGNDPRPR